MTPLLVPVLRKTIGTCTKENNDNNMTSTITMRLGLSRVRWASLPAKVSEKVICQVCPTPRD